MWFKNLRIYRFTKPFDYSAESLEKNLEKQGFVPCGSQDFSRYGWVPPLGPNSEMLAHTCNGNIMICARKQEKILPAAAVNELVQEKVIDLEAKQQRGIYRKEKNNLKEDVIHALLPRALTRSAHVFAYFAKQQKMILIDAASAAKAEEFLECLRSTLGSLPVVPLSCHGDAAETMTRWIQKRPADGFMLDDECELRNPRESANIVRCKNQELESDEVLGHIKAGKRVIQLGLNWRDSIRFILGEDFSIKRLRFEEIIQQEADGDAEDAATQFDQDFAVMALQLGRMVDELLKEFGGIEKDK